MLAACPYRSCKHDAASTSAGTGSTWNWCCHRGWVVAAGALGDRAGSAAGVAVVAGIAVDEPARPRCADAAEAAPAAADAEIGEDDALGCAAPQLVPAVAPIVDTPSRSSSDYLTRASNYSRGTPFPPFPPFLRARNVQRG